MGATFKLQDMTLSTNSRKLAESIKAKKLLFHSFPLSSQLLSFKPRIAGGIAHEFHLFRSTVLSQQTKAMRMSEF